MTLLVAIFPLCLSHYIISLTLQSACTYSGDGFSNWVMMSMQLHTWNMNSPPTWDWKCPLLWTKMLLLFQSGGTKGEPVEWPDQKNGYECSSGRLDRAMPVDISDIGILRQITDQYYASSLCNLTNWYAMACYFADAQCIGGGAAVHVTEASRIGHWTSHVCVLHLRRWYALVEAAARLLLSQCGTGALLSVHQVAERLPQR